MPTERFAELLSPLDGEDALETTPMAEFSGLAFIGMQGWDALSRCFEYDIAAISGSPDIDANKLLGEEIGLKVTSASGHPDRTRFFHGIVDAFRFEGQDDEGHWHYRLIVRPRLWLLGKTTDNRIFQEMTVKDIVSAILDQHGCSDYEWDLRGNPPMRDYCVQYGETDLDFIQRLLEHEGIFYFFRFLEGKHTLVLCDRLEALAAAKDCATLRYREGKTDRHTAAGVITRFRRIDSIVSGSHSMTDYDFTKPSADLMAMAENNQRHRHSDGARYSYPGIYAEHARGADLAGLRNREDQAHAHVITAQSTASAPASGNVFELADFPRNHENITYAIEQVEYHIRGHRYRARQPDGHDKVGHDGAQRGGEGTAFSALYTLVPQDAAYCPPRMTRRPVMAGPQTAVVVGPAGEEIYTDKYSRVKVQFHWDRQGRSDEHSTCFIRVSSAWGGAGWGFIQIPRIGQEVIVDFLEGDPDQPIITGRVYNAAQMPPYGLPGSATQSGWKSNSTPGGGGWNELRFEDKKGSEEVYFQAEKDHNELVKNNESRHIGNDWTEEVVRDATQWVGHDRTEKVDNNKSTTVGVDRTVSIGDNDDETVGKNRSLKVGVDETISVGANATETIGANHKQDVGANQTITVAVARTDRVGAAESRTVGAGRSVAVGAEQVHAIGKDDSWTIGADQQITIGKNRVLDVGQNSSQTIGEDLSINAGKTILIEAADSITLVCGSAKLQMKKDGTILIDGKDISAKASGKINLKASSDVIIKGSKISQN